MQMVIYVRKHDKKMFVRMAGALTTTITNILLTKTLVDTNANEHLLCCQVVDVSVQAVVVLVEVDIRL